MSGSEERELPEGWVDVRLGDCSEIRSGVGFPHAYQGRTEGDLPFAKVGDVSPAARLTGRLSTAANWISEKDLGPLKAKPIPSGSVVFAKIGEAIRSNLRALTTRPLVTDNNVMAVSPQPQLVLSEYLFAFLKTQDLYPLAVATTVPSLRKSDLEELTLPLPPLNEQKRIVARIDALTEKSREAREALEEVPVLLDKLRQSILAAAFRGELTREWRAKNPDVEPASVLLERIRQERRKKWEEAQLAKFKAKGKLPKDDSWKKKYVEPQPVDTTDLPDLPEGWCWAALEEVCPFDAPIVYGIIQPGPNYPGGVPYIRPVDITSERTVDPSSIQCTSPEIAAKYRRAALRSGDLVLSIVGTIGKVLITPPALDGANITQSSVRIRPPDSLPGKLLSLMLESPQLVGQFERYRFGNAVQRLNVEHARRLALPLPPRAEVAPLASILSQRLARLGDVCLAPLTNTLQTLDSAILAKAFRGELVPQDPNDEPASVLLERIAAERAAAGRAAAGRAAAESKGKKPRSRLRPVLGELSAEAKAARAPLRPEELVEAQHDRVHRDPGRARAARTVRNSRRGTT